MPNNLAPKNEATEVDDLTQIKGIGDTTQQWLRETFHVRTYHDLAMLAVDEIEAKLRADGKIASRNKIEAWVGQAQAHVGSKSQFTAAEKLEVGHMEAWQTIASFVVVFEERETEGHVQLRTNAHHMEADETQTWAGIRQVELMKWINGQLGEKGFQDIHPTPMTQIPVPRETDISHDSNQLEQILATVNHLISGQASVSAIGHTLEPIATQEPAVPGSAYSPKLQGFLATANRLASQEIASMTAHTRDVRPQSRSALSSPVSGQGSFDMPTEPFNERLQEVIAKSRQLSGVGNSLSKRN